MTDRQLVSSGSYLEPIIGFSRAVRVGNIVAVGGTAPIAAGGGTAAKGDVLGQARRCFEIIGKALGECGAGFEHVARTRVLLIDMALWSEASRAHAEIFKDIRPVTTVMADLGLRRSRLADRDRSRRRYPLSAQPFAAPIRPRSVSIAPT